MTSPTQPDDTTTAARRKRVRVAERRSLVRRHDFAVEAVQAALARMTAVVAELALLDQVDDEPDRQAGR